MHYKPLGRSGAQVSRIALGTMNFGTVLDEPESHALLDFAFQSGITFIDTADVYGGPPLGTQHGRTEEILGRWLSTGGRARRDQIVLTTKVYGDTGDGPNDGRLSAMHIRRAIEASLRRLGTDHIDLYQMHHIDRRTPIDEIFEAFTLLREQGKILYWGSSNFAGWNLAQYQEVAAARGQSGLVSEQSVYNLANRMLELEVIPAAEHYGIGLLPWSPLAGGLLGGVLKKAERSRSAQALQKPGVTLEQVKDYEALADDAAIPPSQLALAWLLRQPAVSAVLVGPRTTEQLVDAVEAVALTLPDDLAAAVEEIWPGPGGAAPEAYAW